MTKKKLVGFPDYLFKLSESYPGEADRMCLWLCSECGAPYHFRKQGNKHGRPAGEPIGDTTFYGRVGPCWRSREYSVKCASPKGGRILYHEGFERPSPEEVKEVAAVASRHRKESEKLDKARRAAIVESVNPSTKEDT